MDPVEELEERIEAKLDVALGPASDEPRLLLIGCAPDDGLSEARISEMISTHAETAGIPVVTVKCPGGLDDGDTRGNTQPESGLRQVFLALCERAGIPQRAHAIADAPQFREVSKEVMVGAVSWLTRQPSRLYRAGDVIAAIESLIGEEPIAFVFDQARRLDEFEWRVVFTLSRLDTSRMVAFLEFDAGEKGGLTAKLPWESLPTVCSFQMAVPRSEKEPARDCLSSVDERTKTVADSWKPATGTRSRSCLVVIYGPNLGKKHDLDKLPVVIGRTSDNPIEIASDSVSRRHARILDAGAAITICDLGSTNGTFVNEVRLAPNEIRTLRDRDILQVGQTIMKFLTGNDLEAAYHQEIYNLRVTDGMTGIANRAYLNEELQRVFSRCQRYNAPLGFCLIGIDHFKDLNSTYKYEGTDALIRHFASIIKRMTRKEDTAGRWRDTEFAIIQPQCSPETARQIGEEILRLIADDSFTIGGEAIPVTASVGIAISKSNTTLKELTDTAESALHEAQRTGGNRTVLGIEGAAVLDALIRTRVVGLGLFKSYIRHELQTGDGNVSLIAAELVNLAALRERLGMNRLDEALLGVVRQVASTLGDGDRVCHASETLFIMTHGDPQKLLEQIRPRLASVEHAAWRDGYTTVKAGSDAEPDDVLHEALKRCASKETPSEGTLPFPIAFGLRLVGAHTSPVDRALASVRTVDNIIRYLMGVVLADLASRPEPPVCLDEPLERTFSRALTLGKHWGLAKRTARFLGEKDAFVPELFGLLAPSKQTQFVLDAERFIDLRNDMAHRSANVSDELNRLCTSLVDNLEFLHGYLPFAVESLDVDEDANLYRIRWLVGDNPILAVDDLTHASRMPVGSTYLRRRSDDAVLRIDPFLLYDTCPACGAGEVFFLDSIDGDSVTFVSCQTSHTMSAEEKPNPRRQKRTAQVLQALARAVK